MTPYINVQRGEETMTTATLDVNITAVDLSHAFIIVSVRGQDLADAQNLDEIYVTAEFVDADTIRFTRHDTTENCNVAWQVVEADPSAPTPAFEVQTGEIAFGSGDSALTDSITDISDASNAMIMCIPRFAADGDDNERVKFRGTFDDTSTVRIQRAATGTAATVRYFVVKWSSDFVVRKGSVAMTSSATASDTFSAVTTSRSMVFIEYDATNGGIAQTAVKAHLASTTQINFERETATGSCNIEYAVVEFPTGNAGQSNAADWAGAGYTDTTTISSVTLANTLIVHSNECTGTGTAQPRGLSTCRLSDATTVSMARSYDGQTHTVSWTLMDTSGWTFVPGTQTNSERAAKTEGIDTANSERAAKTEGQYAANTWQIQRNDDGAGWQDIEAAIVIAEGGGVYVYDDSDSLVDGVEYCYRVRQLTDGSQWSNSACVTYSAGTEVTSERAAVVVGALTVSSTRAAKTTGEATANSTRAATVHGENAATADRAAKTTGEDNAASERAAVVTGEDTAAAERAAKATGVATAAAERAATAHGVDTDSSERAAKTDGVNRANSTRAAKTHGIDTAQSERSAKTTGSQDATSERAAKAAGIATDTSERAAKAHGFLTDQSERPAKTEGVDTAAAERAATLHGTADAASQRAAIAHGFDTAASERAATLHGVNQAAAERAAKAHGTADAQSVRSAKTTGVATAAAERPAKATGKNATASTREAKTTGQATVTSERSAEVSGVFSADDERSAKAYGVFRVGSERGAKCWGKLQNPYCPGTDPYTPQVSPYSEQVSPYSRGTSPYSPGTEVYTSADERVCD